MRSVTSICLLSVLLVSANIAIYLGVGSVGMDGLWVAPLSACVTTLIISWWPA